jgi:hypothetical protein
LIVDNQAPVLVNLYNTGGWQIWRTVEKTIALTAGYHTFTVKAVYHGWNFNWFSADLVTNARFSEGGKKVEIEKVVAYPNPAKTNLHIILYAKTVSKANIGLINSSGITSIDRSYSLSEGENVIDLPIKGLPSGLYFLDVRRGTGEVERQKVIVE